jgi:hypothetical protein
MWPERVGLPGRYFVNNAALADQVWQLVVPNSTALLSYVDGRDARSSYDPTYPQVPDESPDWLRDVRENDFSTKLESTVRWFVEHPEWLQL